MSTLFDRKPIGVYPTTHKRGHWRHSARPAGGQTESARVDITHLGVEYTLCIYMYRYNNYYRLHKRNLPQKPVRTSSVFTRMVLQVKWSDTVNMFTSGYLTCGWRCTLLWLKHPHSHRAAVWGVVNNTTVSVLGGFVFVFLAIPPTSQMSECQRSRAQRTHCSCTISTEEDELTTVYRIQGSATIVKALCNCVLIIKMLSTIVKMLMELSSIAV